MNQEDNSNQFLDRVLSSLDGMERARPQPWFYTRLKARLQKEDSTAWERISRLVSRPSVAIASLCMVLLLNVFFLLQSDQETGGSYQVAQGDQVVESESLIASSSSFDYENITP